MNARLDQSPPTNKLLLGVFWIYVLVPLAWGVINTLHPGDEAVSLKQKVSARVIASIKRKRRLFIAGVFRLGAQLQRLNHAAAPAMPSVTCRATAR